MFGWVLVAFLCVGMARMADVEGRSPVLWGAITLVACLGVSAVLLIPYLNILVAGVLVFVGLTVCNAMGR